MVKYRRAGTIRAGFIGVVLITLVIAVGLAPERIIGWATTIRYQAVFADLSGLAVGNDVTVSGMTLGKVTAVSLQDPDARVTFTVDSRTPLGSQTTAHIRTGTLLGQRVLVLESSGDDTLSPMEIIPRNRTSSPYTLTDAIGELTTNTTDTDTARLNEALNTLSDTIDQIAPHLGPTFDGLTRISEALNSRNTALAGLFNSGRDVTEVLADRSAEVGALILDANDLVGTLNERRQTIAELLAYTSAMAREVTGLARDNEAELAPTLEKLNTVLEMLERQRDNIALALPRLAKYQVTLGETVASGPYYSAYIPNLDLPPILQPFLDYAFGFRRGVNAGQPPDNAGPRAELPFPRNGIPQRPPR
ncbi:mammalian cell entry protein [Mycolicibacterium duvalii]|uniref:Mammalian cell entry protein n=1 Tax=Mycolicibacterium duvalii TaxID=39688 RepID=A0A7I7K1V2_9MYCO|nr:MCE family protein [Mycolicibacterium duvalii]MCV7370167.1 MCE family protein [Mycolicibacterium duvalii]PEG38528.1 mammalian cell entry protein [Mycolicibacterium duvalii]BBX17469.1 mammalian cell entry protein [Mycolicibacterium duvalii]